MLEPIHSKVVVSVIDAGGFMVNEKSGAVLSHWEDGANKYQYVEVYIPGAAAVIIPVTQSISPREMLDVPHTTMESVVDKVSLPPTQIEGDVAVIGCGDW